VAVLARIFEAQPLHYSALILLEIFTQHLGRRENASPYGILALRGATTRAECRPPFAPDTADVDAILASGGPELALYGFIAFYVLCVGLTWWFYARRNAGMPC
jgi:nitrate/nitrite transporter NarK